MAWRWLDKLPGASGEQDLRLAIPSSLVVDNQQEAGVGYIKYEVNSQQVSDINQYITQWGNLNEPLHIWQTSSFQGLLDVPLEHCTLHMKIYIGSYGTNIIFDYDLHNDDDTLSCVNGKNGVPVFSSSANVITMGDLAVRVDDTNKLADFVSIYAYEAGGTYYLGIVDQDRVLFTLQTINGTYSSITDVRSKLYEMLFGDEPGPTPSDPDTFTFYNHSKKVNSTKQPISGVEITGYFRDAYNLLNPTIMIEADNEFPYNYVSWYDSANDIRRYYWIQNKAWMRNKLIEITLEEDMLATFKSSIGNMNAFVVRSASNFNPLITDTAWSTKNGIDLTNATPVNQPFDVANGFYVVGIMEKDYQSVAFARKGGVDYFAVKEAELSELIDFLADKGATGEWGDYRPIDRVVYLRFYPFNPGNASQGTFPCDLFYHQYNDGGQTVTASFYWLIHTYDGIVGTLVSGSGYVDFGSHPDAGNDKTYLNYMPYTEMELKAGPFGRIDLSKNLIDKDNVANRLDFTVTADLISGLAKLHIFSGQNLIYYTEDHSCTVDIAISAEFVNRYSDIQQRDFNKKQAVLQTASQAASAGGALVGAATFQNPLLLASGVALMANAIATQERGKDQYIIDSYNMSIPQLSCRGTNGTWMKISENWRLITTYHRIAGDGGAILGRPKNDTVQISSCSGYLICNAASFEDSNAILTEIIAINEYLNKGFYYE